ncbi:putative molybdopterin binding domain-containing protein [Lactarius hengduanensis]|nr:putative molybdopterin binding domain-containing protein [Lactarius hengduanensis]
MPPTPRVHNYRLFVLPRRSPTFRTMTTTARSYTAAKAPTTPTSVFSSSGHASSCPLFRQTHWVLNGKTLDRNSNYFARYCFENGIELKRIEVIPDEEDEIIEASRRMVQKYDFVITTGGIGPTHDDITYASLAKAFNQPLVHHAETLHRMTEMSKHRSWVHTQDEEQRRAREKMALFPADAETLFVASDIWVKRKLCVFPGIPSLFQKDAGRVEGISTLPPSSERPFRHQIFTSLPESSIAPYLTSLQKRVKEEGVSVGSYPLIRKGVYVSLIGQNEDRIRELGKEVEVNIQGKVVTEQEIREAKGTSSNL